MLFRKKIERVLNLKNEESRPDQNEEKLSLEKGDYAALIIAAFGVYLPVMILLIGLICGLVWFFFFRI